MSAKFDRAAYSIVQHIKDRFHRNAQDGVFFKLWSSLNAEQQRVLALMFDSSVDEGYAASQPKLQEVHDDELLVKPGFASIPDDLLDASADIIVAARRGKKDLAAFTIVRDEPFFLERWCAYYAHAVGAHNLYVIDNGTVDTSVELAKARWPEAHFIPLASVACDWALITNVAKCFQRMLLLAHRAVIFTDVDEFLVTDVGSDLSSFCKSFLASTEECVKAEGWGIVQQIDSERRIMPTDSMLADRSLAWRAPGYDKTLLSKVPLEWSKGSHVVRSSITQSSGLILLHARDVDFEVFHDHCKHRAALAQFRSPSFQGTTDRDQIATYFRTRIAPWEPSSRQYTDVSREVIGDWRKQFVEAGA